MISNFLASKTLRHAAIILIIAIILSALLALDLANRGLAWRVFYDLTGEESPLAQVRGVIELGSNVTRPPLDLARDTPVLHTEINPYGVNTFLEQEVEPEKREQSMRMIRDAGFTWIRQQFSWADIEIDARGDFEDRRNLDVTGAISAWDKYDQIVALAEQYDVQIMARLDNPPAWTHADAAAGSFAPPDDLQDFVNFAATVATRYRGRVRYFQVWNEPNIYPEWGEQAVNPEAYTEMLCQTYAALKAVDPQIVVITGALAPTLELTGRNLNDLIFLQRMFQAGVGDCFDVLSAQAYGFFSAATDRRTRPTTITFSRHRYIRDLMVANGQAHKPIWLSEVAWNAIDAPEVPPDVTAREAYGVTTPEQAARYLPEAYRLTQREYPYVGVMFTWFFKRAADYERGQSWYYFRMVDPDFTPRPVYDSMRAAITTDQPALYVGVHPPDSWETERNPDAARVVIANAPFGYGIEIGMGEGMAFRANGTDVILRLRADAPGARLIALVDGEIVNTLDVDVGVRDYPNTITFSDIGGTRAIALVLADDSAAPVMIEAITIDDQRFETYFALFVIIVVPVLSIGALLIFTILERRKKA